MFLFLRNEQSNPVGNPNAAQDLYGLGVRVGLYLQSIGMVLRFFGGRKDFSKGLKLASGSVTISILASWFVFATQKLFSPSEAFIVILLLQNFTLPARISFPNPQSITGEVPGVIALLASDMMATAALLWLAARLCVTLPLLGTDNVVFLFTKVPIDGGYRYYILVFSIFDAAISLVAAFIIIYILKYRAFPPLPTFLMGFKFGRIEKVIKKIVAKLERLNLLKLPTGIQPGNREEIVEKAVEMMETSNGVGFLFMAAWAIGIIAIELTILSNHLSPTTDLQSPGQSIPLVTGIIVFTDSVYGVARRVFGFRSETLQAAPPDCTTGRT